MVTVLEASIMKIMNLKSDAPLRRYLTVSWLGLPRLAFFLKQATVRLWATMNRRNRRDGAECKTLSSCLCPNGVCNRTWPGPR